MAIDITNAISVIQAKESALTNTDDSTEIIKLLNAIKLTEDQVIRSYATVTDLPIASADNEGSIHYVRDTDYLYGSNGCQWNVLGQYFAGNGICISNNCIINTFSLGDYNTDALAEGSTNLYYTDARSRAAICGICDITYDNASGTICFDLDDHTTDALAEGTCNLYYTDAKVDTNLNQGTAANGDYLKWNGCDYEWATVPAGYTDNDVNNFLAGGTAGNIVTCGYLAGPATFTIDPAAVGDNTGTVVIAGNLQVDGTTTTVNSCILDICDLNITLAKGAINTTAADGAGITVDCANATLTYDSGNDRWVMNKDLSTSLIGTVSSIANHCLTNLSDVDLVSVPPSGGQVLVYDNVNSIWEPGTVSSSSTYQENKIIATSDGQTVFAFSAAFEGYNSTTPANSHLEIYWNGSRLIYGPNNDYTITANNEITLTSGTGIVTGDIIFAVSISNMTLSRLYGP
jgi:hypothetical protein